MSLNIDELKKKIIYRSNYRGTKEMDKLLGKFVKKYINELEEEDLIDLDKLLNIDDTNLFNFSHTSGQKKPLTWREKNKSLSNYYFFFMNSLVALS